MNTAMVLLSKDYFNQIFCLNIKLNKVSVNGEMINIISKMAGKNIIQDGGIHELSIGFWGKSHADLFCTNLDLLRMDKKLQFFFIVKLKTIRLI
jgi:hypothetical protein